jgi:penicillin-binding protein 2
MFNFFDKQKNKFQFEIEPHEILVDSLAKKREEELGISEKKFEVPISRSLNFIFYLSILLLLILLFRSFQLQILENENFKKQAESNRYIFHKISAQRGVIYDRNLNQLVFNREVFSLVCKKELLPIDVKEREKILEKISQILKVDKNQMKEKIEKESSPVIISNSLDLPTLIILETKIEEFPGFEIVQNSIREYPEGETFSHILGYLGRVSAKELKEEPDFYSNLDYTGKSGIEGFYEKILRKIPGKIKIERDALQRVISKEIVSFPQNGKSIVLSIDASLQRKIKEVLQKRLQEVKGKGAAAVALDPKTGEVLSLVSLPTFDNNIFFSDEPEKISKLFQDKNQPLFNRAISGQYLIGSTIKPIVAIAALEEKIIDPSKTINCQGEIVIPNPWNPSLPTIKKDWKTHGITDLKKAIAESCNVYFYTIGAGLGDQKGLGVEKIKKYLKLFGFGEKTNIDLFGEKEGLVPDPEWKMRELKEPWRDGDTLNLSIGQGFVLATPLQVANAFSAIANGGKLFEPKILKKIVDSTKNPPETLEEFPPKVIRENFVDKKTLEIVREGMRQAVTGLNSPHATALLLNSLPVSCAAKTGTAEVWEGGEKIYNSWITVFAPYEDPKIVLTIMIEGVKAKEVENQLIVVPVAKEVLEWYFSQGL